MNSNISLTLDGHVIPRRSRKNKKEEKEKNKHLSTLRVGISQLGFDLETWKAYSECQFFCTYFSTTPVCS